jgi:hypothetical protein
MDVEVDERYSIIHCKLNKIKGYIKGTRLKAQGARENIKLKILNNHFNFKELS